jgi:glycosyltransferase involved in cell wall biosynthesis
MKILHIITSIDKGGAENHVVSLIEAQRKKNNSIGIFYSKKGSYWKTYLKSLGVFVNQPYFINEKFFFLRLIKFFFDLIQLRRIITKYKPDILHAHLPYMELLGFFCIFLLKKKPKLIISKHVDNIFFNGSEGQKRSFLGSFFAKLIATRTSKFIAISNSVKKFLVSDFVGIDKKKVKVIYYGLDKLPYSKTTKSDKKNFLKLNKIKKDTIIVGCIARLVPQKSLTTLFEAIALYKKDNKKKIKLVLVGKGFLKDNLKEYANRQNIQKDIIWIDFLDDVKTFYNSIDIFALSSLYEGFGLVFLEAMLCKKPIVSTNVSAISEVVANDINGILVPVKNSYKMKNAFLTLSKKNTRINYGLRGYQRVKTEFTVKKMYNETNKIYKLTN